MTVRSQPVRVLVLPGLGGSGPEHWQTRWEACEPGCARVEQRDWDRPELGDWLRTVDEMLEAGAGARGPRAPSPARSLRAPGGPAVAAVGPRAVRAQGRRERAVARAALPAPWDLRRVAVAPRARGDEPRRAGGGAHRRPRLDAARRHAEPLRARPVRRD